MMNLRLVKIPSVDGATGSALSAGTGWGRWRAARVGPWLTVCVGAACFFLGQFAGAVQKAEEVLRADSVFAGRFELLGRDGKRAALLRNDPQGATSLSFYDGKQAQRLVVGISERGEPALRLFDPEGKCRLTIDVDSEGSPHVRLEGEPRVGAVILLTIDKGGPSMSFSQSKGGRLSVLLDNQGQPRIDLQGTGNERGVSLSAGANDQEISLTGRNGVKRVSWTMDADGNPVIHLRNEAGRMTATMKVTKDGEGVFKNLVP